MNNSFAQKYGTIAGIGTILFLLLFYFIDQRIMLKWSVYWAPIVLYVMAMVWAVKNHKEAQGDQITFKEGLSTAFLTFLIANLFFHIFNYVLFKYVDPDLVSLQKEISMDLFNTTLKGEQYEEMKAQMEEADFSPSLSKSLYAFAKGAIGGFILSLLVAGLMRNR